MNELEKLLPERLNIPKEIDIPNDNKRLVLLEELSMWQNTRWRAALRMQSGLVAGANTENMEKLRQEYEYTERMVALHQVFLNELSTPPGH